MSKTVEELLESPYWIVDILPSQVPKDSPGQYFAVEKYFLQGDRLKAIKQKHIDLVLKLNCYRDISIEDRTDVNPSPEQIASEMRKRYLYIMTGESMILSVTLGHAFFGLFSSGFTAAGTDQADRSGRRPFCLETGFLSKSGQPPAHALRAMPPLAKGQAFVYNTEDISRNRGVEGLGRHPFSLSGPCAWTGRACGRPPACWLKKRGRAGFG